MPERWQDEAAPRAEPGQAAWRVGLDDLSTSIKQNTPVARCSATPHSPNDDELQSLLQHLITRLMKMSTCRDVLVDDMGHTASPSSPPLGKWC